jgi:lambda repressor-like predicted transcriptional regulator
MHPADIKAAIQKAGSSQTAIARSLSGRAGRGSVSPTAVHAVVHGMQRSQRIAQRISQVTGIPVATLWPGAYPLAEMLQTPRNRSRSVTA